MTRDAASGSGEMEAGRELDALVAEKVMGLPAKRTAGGSLLHAEYGYGIPEYSTDISAAWAVVEKMEDDGWGHRHLKHSARADLGTIERVHSEERSPATSPKKRSGRKTSLREEQGT